MRFHVSVLAAYAAMGCLVSFNDYPTGDLRATAGQSQGTAGAAAGAAGSAAIAGTGGAAGTGATGGSLSGFGGDLPGAGGAPSDCALTPEICDGLDNNCDDAVDEGDACPPACSGAIFLGQAYMFCTQPGDRAEAAAQCAARDMALVRIDSLAENDFLFETMSDVFMGIQTDMHIGASDAANEGHWIWPDGTEFWNGDTNGMAVDGAFEHWAFGAPNNQSETFREENCGVIRLDDPEGAWGDATCDKGLPFACEPE